MKKIENNAKKIMVVILFLFVVASVPLNNDSSGFQKEEGTARINNDYFFDSPQTAYSMENSSFGGRGDPQKVMMMHTRNETIEDKTTLEQGITITNPKSGWNMTEFELNFTNLATTGKYIPFEIRNDGSLEYSSSGIRFATSFTVPNSCYLKNISLFLQYWGGKDPFGGSATSDNSRFSITIYNSTFQNNRIEPNSSIHSTEDETIIDLTDKDLDQPSRWYQANFSKRILNITNTYNRTFFAVFESIDFPTWTLGAQEAYIYYANEEADDLYNSRFYKNSGSGWTSQEGKKGMLKVNLDPISTNPSPKEINLTVFRDPVDNSGLYQNSTFYPHMNDEFKIPIDSPWFTPVHYNTSFIGKFQYNMTSTNAFNATISGVTWNSSLYVSQFPDMAYNNTISFYHPKEWDYNSTYNGTALYSNVYKGDGYVEVKNATNDLWYVIFNQTLNAIQAVDYRKSSDKNEWYNIDSYANMTDYINISSSLFNKGGSASIRVYSEGLQFSEEKNITNDFVQFSLWRSDLNTSIIHNNSKVFVQLMAINGTVAGIETFSFRTVLSALNLSLINAQSQVLKNDMSNFQFSLQNSYNKENIELQDIYIFAKKEGGTWTRLEEFNEYELEYSEEGKFNVSFDTSDPFFEADTYELNFTVQNQYYENSTYLDTLIIQYRSFNLTINGANNGDRIYQLGDYATYFLYLNDTITGNGIDGMDFTIKTNLTGESKVLDSIAYSIMDDDAGNYNLTISTNTIYENSELKNITVEFYAQKSGIYDVKNKNDTLKIYNQPRETALSILSNSSTDVIIGNQLWVAIWFYDISNNNNLTNANFEIANSSNIIPSYAYLIDEHPNYYNISINFEYLEVGFYNLSISANHSREGKLTYKEAEIHFDFSFSKTDFFVTIDDFPLLYTNDTRKSVFVEISYKLGVIDDAKITVYLGPNKLSIANLEEGKYEIFLDTTNLNISESYLFNLTIQKEKFNKYINDTTLIEISPFPTEIVVPADYQNLVYYQEEFLEMVVILKDTFRKQDIVGASVRMRIESHTPYSNYFEEIASDFGWYEGTLPLGELSPGEYIITINMSAKNYLSSSNTANLTILKREISSVNFMTDLKDSYVWEEKISFEFQLISDNIPIKNQQIQITVIEIFQGGELSEETLYTTTNGEGHARADYILGECSQFRFIINFSGSEQYKPSSYSQGNIEVHSPTEQVLLNIAPFTPFLIGALISFSGYMVYKKKQKKKLREEWHKKSQHFLDALNIEYILITHKASGMALITENYGQLEFDGDLVSGSTCYDVV